MNFALYTRLYHAAKAKQIPPIWIDAGVIRVQVPGGFMRLGPIQAQELLLGKKRIARRHIGWEQRRAEYLREKSIAAAAAA